MPGYVIHLAVGQEYYRKHSDLIDDCEAFKNGTIAPDRMKDFDRNNAERTQTHTLTLEKNPDELSDYEKGYVLHLFTDKLFYQAFKWKPCIYEDYDKTNRYVCEKYGIVLPKHEVVKNKVQFKEGKSEVFTKKQIDLFIEEVSNFSLAQMVQYLTDEYGNEKIVDLKRIIEKQ